MAQHKNAVLQNGGGLFLKEAESCLLQRGDGVSAQMRPAQTRQRQQQQANHAYRRKKKQDVEDPTNGKSGVIGLFRCASRCDVALMVTGLLFAIIHGASFPILALVFGQMTNTFVLQAMQGFANSSTPLFNATAPAWAIDLAPSAGTSASFRITDSLEGPSSGGGENTAAAWVAAEEGGGALTREQFTAYMSTFALYYVFIGFGVLAAAFMQTLCWELACERQVYRLRQLFFTQVLRQDITWFDQNQSGDLTNKLADDMERIREGIGSKFSMVTQYVATFLAGLVVGVAVNWRLTLVILAVAPVLVATSGYMAKIAASSAAREQLKYGMAGGIAEEVLASMRTVAAFGGQPQEIQRYGEALEEGRWVAMKKYYVLGVGMAIVFFLTYAAYGLAFWYGSQLIAEGLSTPGSIFTVFFSVMAGAFSLGNALPFVNAVSTAVGAASTIFAIVDRVPNIDANSGRGARPSKVRGRITFQGVTFAYPTRPEVNVLKNFNLDIEPGKRVALVGSSGAGKSTIVSLLQRFYDPSEGSIQLDGTDVRKLNVPWLRAQIGVVSQEPVLFGTSIYENIRYGRDDVNKGHIIMAASMANAHDFISRLPQGYDTLVGDRGAQLSGGQKQRIAIARALVRDPKVLLLDEATSALDVSSEAVVQEALDKAMEGRTTIIVAHRLSTIRNANLIYAMKALCAEKNRHLNDRKSTSIFNIVDVDCQSSRCDFSPRTNGEVAEWGDHDQLMARGGLYHSLVTLQTLRNQEELSSDSEDEKKPEIIPTSEIAKVFQNTTTDYKNGKIGTKYRYGLKSCSTNTSLNSMDGFDNTVLECEAHEEEVSSWELIALNAPEWHWLLLGLVGCAVFGSVMPVFAFFYGEIFATFTLTGDALRSSARFWTFMFLVLAIGSALSFLLQLIGMTNAAEKLVLRLRFLAFENILRQSSSWFDLKKNSAGRLANRLARDAPLVKGASGLRLGMMVSALVTLVAALTIALINGWKLALLLLIAVPLLMAASYQQTLILRRNQRRDADLLDEAGRVASECIQNVRTVQSLGKEKLFYYLYVYNLQAPFKEAKKQAFFYAIVFALSQAIIYLMYGAAFRFGAYLIEIGDMTPTEVYRVFFALAFCAASVGQTSAYMQDYTKAKNAANLMFELIKQVPEIDVSATYGARPDILGEVILSDVRFRYPSRPAVPVLRGLTVLVRRGQTLALVGASGCGKSTVISLIERFYDPLSGQILVDGYDIRTVNLAHLRANIGLVTQEPVLFDCTIKENIAYGGVKHVTDYDIVEACRIANIHDFIISLPQGYDTMVGERGAQLSGGQKQRVAIARALIRDPKILLLDEATSALDTESEKVVQEALDRARKGRTCIVVAHRLSTIQNADCIAVMHQGKIVESGTHEELRMLRGRYYALVQGQKQ